VTFPYYLLRDFTNSSSYEKLRLQREDVMTSTAVITDTDKIILCETFHPPFKANGGMESMVKRLEKFIAPWIK
jgi:hypothetical protein